MDMYGIELVRHWSDANHVFQQANIRVAGHPRPDLNSELPADFFDKQSAAALEIQAELDKRRADNPDELKFAQLMAWVSADTTTKLNPAAQTAADAILDARLTGTWTAFEVLAGDLWADAINCHPNGLSELKGKKRGTVKGNDDSNSLDGLGVGADDDEGKTVPLKLIQKYKFNLAAHMGTILRAKLSFDSLVRVRDAYRRAFYDDYRDVDAAINDDAIDKLFLVRNLIVHKAGIVDEMFARRTRSVPEFAGLEIDKPFPRDESKAIALIDPVIRSSVRLISAVDDWIANHAD
ncbi:hypothetical protein ETAA1_07810 [Urbifossiella limnaea]|uniref:Uncharacterized protein n=2 Tax=Urbifossiella limnaea TaxID=2528023 RepID=A0A517XN02_9BACT|nr:hypothetical protein ETAA1_07810 [Urbifossiella limnaea]